MVQQGYMSKIQIGVKSLIQQDNINTKFG